LEKQLTKAVIFDMDGLLVDSEPFWRKAEIEAFGEVGIPLTDADCRETMGFRLNEVVNLWYQRQPWNGANPLETLEKRILDLVTNYILTEANPMPGVDQAITLCRNGGYKMAIASSSPMQLIQAVVDRFELQNTFELLHSAQFETHGKPHPAVFISTADKLNVRVQDCTVLEDSFHGVVAALAAKMKTIAIPDHGSLDDKRFRAAHHVLPSLVDLKLEHLT
jgi:sugar-phosphatase